MIDKLGIKRVLGELPLTAELYLLLRQRRPLSKSFSLQRLGKYLPEWQTTAQASAACFPPGHRVLIFNTLRYWIEHGMLLSLALAGLGHQVTLAYLPYANWRKQLNRFDMRQQNVYARGVLGQVNPLVKTVSLLDVKVETDGKDPLTSLPPPMQEAISQVSLRDTQYTLQIEDFDHQDEASAAARLYHFRLKRNTQAAQALLAHIWSMSKDTRPEVLVTPNGSILEMGVAYQVARYLDIPAATYEFGEQRGRIWIAQNDEVMHQNTDALWRAYRDIPLTDSQWEQVRALYESRQSASLWRNFARLWQEAPSQGGEHVRSVLGLGSRPVVLLAANVIGDSLTLGRQVFSSNMTAWLQRTVQFFASRPDVQLVVRVHPGERFTKGPSVAEVVQRTLPAMPEHIHLVAASDPINTYDLAAIADLGLVYTTTVGMEMAMAGVPVIVAGQTHYRERGFTLDPDSWEAFEATLGKALASPQDCRLTQEQVELAWRYAYRFFFDYPLPFPWHLHFWDELKTWPLERVLSENGQAEFGASFEYLVCNSSNRKKLMDDGLIFEHST